MANQKKLLQKAAIEFRKENPVLHVVYSKLLSCMANFITRSGATDVTVGFKNGKYYERANN